MKRKLFACILCFSLVFGTSAVYAECLNEVNLDFSSSSDVQIAEKTPI